MYPNYPVVQPMCPLSAKPEAPWQPIPPLTSIAYLSTYQTSLLAKLLDSIDFQLLMSSLEPGCTTQTLPTVCKCSLWTIEERRDIFKQDQIEVVLLVYNTSIEHRMKV
jgi:hypothetical protein